MSARAEEVRRRLGQAARELRREATPAEQRLWQELRGHRLAGLGFRRQHPIGPFVVDFACPSRRLVVELDGAVHDDILEQDDARTEILGGWGRTVIRFTNDQALNATDAVLDRIRDAALARPER